MGLGIGKNCEICGDQLNFEKGYNYDETLCKKCEELIPKILNYLSKKKV